MPDFDDECDECPKLRAALAEAEQMIEAGVQSQMRERAAADEYRTRLDTVSMDLAQTKTGYDRAWRDRWEDAVSEREAAIAALTAAEKERDEALEDVEARNRLALESDARIEKLCGTVKTLIEARDVARHNLDSAVEVATAAGNALAETTADLADARALLAAALAAAEELGAANAKQADALARAQKERDAQHAGAMAAIDGWERKLDAALAQLAQRDATIRVMHQESVAAVRATVAERDAARASERAMREALREVAEALEIMARDMRLVIPDTKPIADVLDGIAGQARALLASPDAARPALPTPCEGHNHDPSDECGIHCPARSTAASSRPDRGDGNEG